MIQKGVTKAVTIVTGTLLLGAIVAFVWWRNLPPTPALLAADTLEKIRSDDISTVADRIPQIELDRIGINKEVAARVLEKFIAPRINELKADGTVVVNQNQGTGNADAGLRFATSGGESLYVSVSAELTPDGSRLKPFFSQTLFIAVLARHVRPGQSPAQRYLTSIQAERSELDAYGVHGVMSGEEFRSWDDLIGRWKNRQ